MKKVLVIEDEPDVARYLSMVLRTNGFEPYVVTDPREAFAMIESVKPDLISLDIMMPEKSGLSMYSQLRGDSAYRDIPVLIVSGMESERQFDFRAYVADGAIPKPDCYFEKPIDVERFIQVIRKLLESRVGAGGE
jgi:CheY-like chemotaxis protein